MLRNDKDFTQIETKKKTVKRLLFLKKKKQLRSYNETVEYLLNRFDGIQQDLKELE